MGCGSSKEKNPDEIKFEMKKTLIPSYDDLFAKIGSILEKAENLRSGLGENTDTMNEIAFVDQLKEGDFTDSIQAWLWSVSAKCEGKITSSNLKVEEEKPYVSLELGNHNECHDFQECLKGYLATCIEGPEILEALINEITELVKTAEAFKDTCKDDATNAGLNPLQIGKAIANTTSNIATSLSGVTKLKNVLEIVKKTAVDVKNLLPKLPKMIIEADEVGEKVFKDKEGKNTPSYCIQYSKKEKRTKQELDLLKKQKEEKNKKKKGGKKEGKMEEKKN